MKKNILRKLIIFIICLFVTYILFYNYISDIIIRFVTPSIVIYIGLMIFTAVILYIFFISILNRKVSVAHINILALLYFGITIVLSFFKTRTDFTGINLNPLNIVNDFSNYFRHTLFFVVTNTVLYFPVGVYIRLKIRFSNIKLITSFILYIFLIETMQYILHKGIFDVNDIIQNTIGFLIGLLCCDIIKKYYSERK
jgi:VanZ like family.